MRDQLGGAEPIAVVGMALRVPGAVSIPQFWQNILTGTDTLTRPTLGELRRAGVSRRQLSDPKFVRSSPLLTDIEYFDAPFFGITGFEAERTEPAHRLFLECVWEAMEAAGLVPGRVGPVTGVFGGAEGHYREEQLSHLMDQPIDGAVQVLDRGKELPLHLGNGHSFFSSRVCHKLDLTGPSVNILAACASSLIAIHLAVQSLRRRECDVAIAGGASVLLPHVGGYVSSVAGMLSSSGRVKPFDADADGTIFGSGVGAVVLRPLQDALAERNPIWGIVRGSGASNDGNPPGKESFIAPSREGQMATVEAAMSDARVAAESIGYLEAHGTATLLGDPIEVASIAEMYRRETSAKGYCGLGSVKGNVGHLRMAAGVISFIKACLALKNRTLPPLANFAEHNPRIDFESSPFFVNTKALEWAACAHPRRAAVSAFGFGGANAHVIVDEYIRTPASSSSRQRHLLTLSARTETALMRRISDLAAALDENPNLETADVAHTLQCGRKAMPHRACFYVNEEIASPSTQLRLAPTAMVTAKSENRPVVFLFPGQGAQRPGMGRDVYDREPLYREIIDRCAALLEPQLGLDIRTLIHPQSGSSDGAEMLRRTANAQPALFVVGYALARQFMSWGVNPEAMLGHSIGEIVAACVADVFSLEDALTLVAARAKLMQACDPGAMAAVFLPKERLNEILAGHDLEIAALNAPNIGVVSGPAANIARFVEKMKKAGVGTRRVETSHAFHSRMMNPALSAFREVLQGIELRAPKIPIISNVTGAALTEEQAKDPEYWSQHLRHTVRFSSGADHLLHNNGNQVFLELGPGRTLCDLIRQHNSEADVFAALEDGAPETSGDEQHSALLALGRLWCAGGAVDWQDFYGEEPRQKLTLPTYPFERRRYWIEPGNFETKAEEGLCLYEPGWRLAELDPSDEEHDGRPWLIFQDEHGLALAVAERLKAQGRQFILLTPGDAFAERGPNSFTVRPRSSEDLGAALVKARARDSGLAPLVLHLWSVTGRSGEHNTIEAFRRSNLTGFYTLVALTQAAYDTGINDIDILVVADGLRRIDGESNLLQAEKGGLLGPVRNVAKEIPAISFRCVDISGFEEQPRDALCNAIIAEARKRDQQSTICLRSKGRYAEELYPFSTPPLGRLRLIDRGTVLITGGLGGLGLKVAGALFDSAKARLVLTSRWEPPPKADWRVRSAKSDKIARALRELIALEERGAELLIVAADLGDINSLRAAVAKAESHFGAINGVIHAAGINTDGPALDTTSEIAEPAFEAKVHGAFNLEEIFSDTPLDFFVYFSSQSSYNPSPGQTIYTASNSVLDILSQRRSLTQSGLNCAIGWAAWEEVGMAAVRAEKRVREAKGHTRHDHDRRFHEIIDHPLLQRKHQGNDGAMLYRSTLHDGDHWVCEHRYNGRAVLAGVTILECLRASYVDLLGSETAVEFSQIGFIRPLFVPDQGIDIEIEYAPDGERQRVEVRSRLIGERNDWTVNAIGFAAPSRPPSADSLTVPDDLPDGLPLAHVVVQGFKVGPRWDCVAGAKIDGDTMWARMRLGEDFRTDMDSFGLHTATFDRALNDPTKKLSGALGVPFTMEKIRIHGRLGAEFFARSTRRTGKQGDFFDAVFIDGAGNILVETEGFVTREPKGWFLGAANDDSKVPGTPLAANQRITVTQPGNLDSLEPCEFELRSPRAGEVRIDVVAAGLNFRDVLSALGQLPVKGDSDPRIGSECSGIVSAVGERVADIRPGDRVVALARDSFAGSVTVDAHLVMPVPNSICMEDAAGIPIVFLTADYAINKLAGLKRGERILIHAAAGGVGLAAVQIAQNIGAEIFATAGHPDKRQYLKSLGVENIMDSRSLDFVRETRERTNGEGVDVVLNSLAGEYIPAGLSLLRYRGRFLEIGKRDILSDSKIGLSPFQNNLAYYAIDLGPMIQSKDPLLVDLFDSLMLRFARGDLAQIPTAVMPIAKMGQAMQRMARAEHIGKIVLKVQEDPDPWRSIFKKFQELYVRGVPVTEGLATLRRLLSGNLVPHYVMALGKRIDDVGQVEHRVGGTRNTRPDLFTEYQAPTTAEEIKLVRIWENAIGVAPIGVYDDFFDLGGDSIIAIQTQFSVADEFGINLSTSAFFDYPTIASLAEQIRTSSK